MGADGAVYEVKKKSSKTKCLYFEICVNGFLLFLYFGITEV